MRQEGSFAPAQSNVAPPRYLKPPINGRPIALRSMRSIARNLVCGMAVNLPPRARRAVLEGLASSTEAYALFQALGKAYRVRDIRVAGEYGLIEGSIDDGGVMAGYARDRHWAGAINRDLVDFFAQHRRGTYIDIGANLGLTTIPVAQIPGVACKSFEPDPANFQYLARNVAAHCRHGNVELFNIALYDCNGTVDFALDVNNHGDHRVHVGSNSGVFEEARRPVIKVAANRLDDALAGQRLEPPIAVKIDTQGSEGRIIAGGKTLIGRADWLVTEYWPYSIRRTGVDIEDLTGFIGRNFATGSIVPGDQDRPPDWQPIARVTERMRAHIGHAESEPYTYYEVYLRK